MFDVSFQEVLVILLIALLVVGPARLPKLARTIGLWVGRGRAMFNTMRSEVERELQLEELRSTRESLKRELDLKREIGGLEQDVTGLGEDVRDIEKDLRQNTDRGASRATERATSAAPTATSVQRSDDNREPAASSDPDRSA